MHLCVMKNLFYDVLYIFQKVYSCIVWLDSHTICDCLEGDIRKEWSAEYVRIYHMSQNLSGVPMEDWKLNGRLPAMTILKHHFK